MGYRSMPPALIRLLCAVCPLVPWLIAGIALGWLTGISIAEVSVPLLGGLLTAVTGLLALTSGTTAVEERKSKLPHVANPLPIALVLVGITAGVAAGIVTRTHRWLEEPVKVEVDRWYDAGAREKKDIANYLMTRMWAEGAPRATVSEAVLKSAWLSGFCDKTKGLEGNQLENAISELKVAGNEQATLISIARGYLKDDSAFVEMIESSRSALCK
jgi:hypothetical protein